MERLKNMKECFIAQIQSHFGNAQQIAASYVSDLDMTKLLRDLRLRKRIFTAVITAVSAALIAALLLWGWGVRQSIIETRNESNGYFVEDIVVH